MRLWVDALRSDRYAQTTDALRWDDGHCCLGVACDVYREATGSGQWVTDGKTWTFVINLEPYGTEEEVSELPETVAEWFMVDYFMTNPVVDVPARPDDPMSGLTPRALSTLNDEGTPFTEIADLIERQLIPAVEPLEDVGEVPEP
jgi:hypothetical protein